MTSRAATTFRRRHLARAVSTAALALGGLGGLVPLALVPARAQTAPPAAAPAVGAQSVSWRQTSVAVSRDGFKQERRGVAIFGNGEPATVLIRMTPTALPVESRVAFAQEARYRFEDGSTFTLAARTTIPLKSDGSPATDTGEWTGEFIGGTGRFAGIAGTVRAHGRSGLDLRQDGILGDNFGAFMATYTLPK